MKGPCRDGVVIFEVLSAGHEALFLGGMWTRREETTVRSQECRVSLQRNHSHSNIISGYLNMSEVVGFLFRLSSVLVSMC